MNPTQNMIKPFMADKYETVLGHYIHFNSRTKWCTATNRVTLVTWYAGDVVESIEDLVIPLAAFPIGNGRVCITTGVDGCVTSTNLVTGATTSFLSPDTSIRGFPKSEHLVFNADGGIKLECQPTEVVRLNPRFLATIYKWSEHARVKLTLTGSVEGVRVTEDDPDPEQWVMILMPIRSPY
jgi:hypothetical protein